MDKMKFLRKRVLVSSKRQRFAWQKRLQPGRANRDLNDATGTVARDPGDMLARHGLGIGPRSDEQPILAKRRDEIFRNIGKQTLDDHPVEGAYTRQDRQAIAKDDPGVGNGEPREPRLGLDRKAPKSFDGEYFPRK